MWRFYFLFMWEWGSCLICTDPSSHTMPDLYRLGCGPHIAVWNVVPQVIIWGTFTWKSMVQTYSCQPGLRVWLSQKGIQREKSASKYKLKVGGFFLLPYGFLRDRSEGKGEKWFFSVGQTLDPSRCLQILIKLLCAFSCYHAGLGTLSKGNCTETKAYAHWHERSSHLLKVFGLRWVS